MIHIILAELRRNQHPLSLAELSQRLEVDHEVLEGMMTTLVRRGYLVEVPLQGEDGQCNGQCATCRRNAHTVSLMVYQLAEQAGS